jgi:hypothetical protein
MGWLQHESIAAHSSLVCHARKEPKAMRTHAGLALMLPICLLASAVHATPHDIATYRDVRWETYSHPGPGFTLQYPYAWQPGKPSRPGEVFNASGLFPTPGISVYVFPREAGQSLDASAASALSRLAGAVGAKVQIDSQRTTKLGGVPARVAMGSWVAPRGAGIPLRTLAVSIHDADRWIVVFATDGVVGAGFLKELEQSALSIRLVPARAEPSKAAP